MTDFNIDDELDKNYRASDIDLSGCYSLGDDIFAVSIISSVPVQYSGVVGDVCFYFKSRGETWRFVIADSKDDCLSNITVPTNPNILFMCTGRYSAEMFSAGYMPTSQAEELIRSSVALWKSGMSIPPMDKKT